MSSATSPLLAQVPNLLHIASFPDLPNIIVQPSRVNRWIREDLTIKIPRWLLVNQKQKSSYYRDIGYVEPDTLCMPRELSADTFQHLFDNDYCPLYFRTEIIVVGLSERCERFAKMYEHLTGQPVRLSFYDRK